MHATDDAHKKHTSACVFAITHNTEQKRLAEEERVRQEELEKQRQELLAALEGAEDERIKAEL